MPIRPENRARYPKDWKAISARIRFERAGSKCECDGECGADHIGRCSVVHGTRHPLTGSIVVLTVAHLGLPSKLPLLLHVTGDAVADEVVQLVGLLMPFDAEEPEWRSMMYDRSASDFLGGPSAGAADFFVALPSRPPRLSPGRPVIFGPRAAAPIWVCLATWRLLSEPLQAATIRAEATPSSDVEAAHSVLLRAALAAGYSEAALRSAYGFVATGNRASAPPIRSLLSSEFERRAADNAVSFGDAFPGASHTFLYHIDDCPENCADDNLKAMCQRCHNRYDMPMRRAGIARRKREALGMAELPL